MSRKNRMNEVNWLYGSRGVFEGRKEGELGNGELGMKSEEARNFFRHFINKTIIHNKTKRKNTIEKVGKTFYFSNIWVFLFFYI